jgi:hypothetical protein
MDALLESLGIRASFLDRRGHPCGRRDGLLYRIRFWAEDEWAALPIADRPADHAYSHALACWASLEPVDRLNN